MDYSPNFEKVKDHYQFNRWNKQMVLDAVGKWIKEWEAEEILSYKKEGG